MDDKYKGELLDAIQLGDEVGDFVGSQVGKYIGECAKRHRERHLLMLADVNPDDVKEVRRLQNEANIPLLLQDWLRQALQKGEAAKFEIKEQYNE